ncbi:MAG: hypothetical protein QW743_00270 [Candidatus Methanomethylicia archaeon]
MNPNGKSVNGDYMEKKILIKRELYEAFMEKVKVKENAEKILNKIVNRAIEEYVRSMSEGQTLSRKMISGRLIREYIEEKVNMEGGPVKIELIIEELEREYGAQRIKTIEIIEKMLKEGILYQPKPGYVMPT